MAQAPSYPMPTMNYGNPYAPVSSSEPPLMTEFAPEGTIVAQLPDIVGLPSLEVSTNTDHEKQVYPLTLDRQVFDIGRDPSNTIVI